MISFLYQGHLKHTHMIILKSLRSSLKFLINLWIPPTTYLLTHLHEFHCFHALATLHEPHSYHEASTNLLYQATMKEKLDALSKNHTWNLIDLSPRKSPVRSKWAFKIKTHLDGIMDRYKAQLVAREFTQEYGISY